MSHEKIILLHLQFAFSDIEDTHAPLKHTLFHSNKEWMHTSSESTYLHFQKQQPCSPLFYLQQWPAAMNCPLLALSRVPHAR